MNRHSTHSDDSSGLVALGPDPPSISRAPGARRPAIVRLAVALTLGAVLLSSPSLADWGRWTWDASVALGQRLTERISDGADGPVSDQRELGLSLGADGFLGDPSLGRFSLGLNLLGIQSGGSGGDRSTRFGFRARIDLLPRSSAPVSLYAGRSFYDARQPDDPFSLLVVPEQTTNWGGRIRFARGVLKGLLLGLDATEVQDTGGGRDEQSRALVDWTSTGPKLRHHLHAERREQEIGSFGLQHENMNVSLAQIAEISSTWRWNLTGAASRNASRLTDQPSVSADSLGINARVTHDVRGRDELTFGASTTSIRGEPIGQADRLGLEVSYQWNPVPAWFVRPFVSSERQRGELSTLSAPRAGVAAGWHGERRAWSTSLNGSFSQGTATTENAGQSVDQSLSAWSLRAVVNHGAEGRLEKTIEISTERNAFRMLRESISKPADFGLPLSGLGTENRHAVHLALERSYGKRNLAGWLEWMRREAADDTIGSDLESDHYRGSLQVGGDKLNFTGSLGYADLVTMPGFEQSVRDASAAAYWTPARALTFRALFGMSSADTVLVPSVAGMRLEVGARLRVGLLAIDFQAAQSTRRLEAGPETGTRTLSWSISRRFGGWLPIVTGTQRRGTIR